MPLNVLLAAGRLPVDVAQGIVLEVATLLERAHHVGHLHGSLSPFAVWLSDAGEVWLEWHPQRSPVAKSLPPEVRQGEHPSYASDVYALGAVAYELLTGLSVSRAWAKAPLVHLQDVAAPGQFNPDVPPAIDDVVARALSRHPVDRPEGVGVLVRLLEVTTPAGWQARLAQLVAEPFYASAHLDLPVTCERAASQPRPSPEAPRLVEAEPILLSEVVELPPAMPMVKIMVVTAAAATLSLLLCLGLSRLSDGERGGRIARASFGAERVPPPPPLFASPTPAPAVAAAAPAHKPQKPNVKRHKAQGKGKRVSKSGRPAPTRG